MERKPVASKELHRLQQAIRKATQQVGSEEVSRILNELFSKTHQPSEGNQMKITYQQLQHIKMSDLEKIDIQQLLKFAGAVNRLMIDEDSKMKRNSIGIVMGMILREIQHREKAKRQAEEA